LRSMSPVSLVELSTPPVENHAHHHDTTPLDREKLMSDPALEKDDLCAAPENVTGQENPCAAASRP